MRLDDQAEASPAAGVPRPAPQGNPEGGLSESRPHLVVVRTRALEVGEGIQPEHGLNTRFWHPRDRRWSENDFESLDHARNFFEKEAGWVLRQEQALDAALAYEWIYDAHRIDFAVSTKEQILEDIGMTPESVDRMLSDVESEGPDLSSDGQREGGGHVQ